MVSEVVKKKIVQLSLDDTQLRKGLSNANSSVQKFMKNISGINSKSVDNVGKATDNLGTKLGNLTKHIPVFGKISDGMSGIQKGTSNAVTGISQVGSEIQGLQRQFTMLEGVATVALGNIATQAINKLGSIVKQWTIAPIMQGFQEYERELDTTRILETALEDDAEQAALIEPTMRSLEKYAATTKYNSQQLNATLSKMVNTGIDIEESRDAIIGFYNLAASSGASNAQATAAMEFGVTQSLATGYMGKQDWNSINNAGMGTMKFKNTLFERAKELDPERMEQLLEEYGSINALFSQGLGEEKWLTADVFLGALQDYSKDETLLQQASNLYTFREALEATGEGVNDAWSKVWVNVLGKGTEAQEIWTPVGNVMVSIGTAIPNAIIGVARAFNAINGRKAVIDAVVTGFKSLKSIVDAIKKAFTNVFPESKLKFFHESITDMNGKAEGISKVFLRIAQTIVKVAGVMKEKFKIDPGVPKAVEEIFTLFFTGFKMVLGLAGTAIKIFEILIPDNIISNVIILIGYFAKLANTIIGFIGKLGSGIELNIFNNTLDSIGKTVSGLWDALTAVLSYIGKVFGGALGELFKIEGGAKKAGVAITFINNSIKSLGKFFEDINKKIKEFTDSFNNKKIDPEKSFSGIKTVRGWIISILNLLSQVKNKFKDSFSGVKINIPKLPSLSSVFGSKKVYAYGEFTDAELAQMAKSQDIYQRALAQSMTSLKSLNTESSKFKDTTDNLKWKTAEFNATLKDNVADYGLVKGSVETLNTTLGEYSGVFARVKRETDLGTSYIAERFKTMFSDITDRFTSLKDRIPKLTEGFFSGLEKVLQSSIDFIKMVIDGFVDVADKLNIPKGVSVAFSELGELLGTIGRGISIQDVNSLLQTLIMFKMLRQFKGGGIGSYIESIKEKFQAFKDFFTAPFDITKGGLFSGIGKLMNSFNRKTNMEALKQGALAILAISGALFILSMIPNDKFPMILKALGMISLAIGALSLVMFAMAKLNRSRADNITTVLEKLGLESLDSMFKKIGNGILLQSIGATLLMFAFTITKLAKVKWKDGLKAIQYIGLILAETLLFMKLLGNTSTKGNALTLLAIGISLTLMVGVINKFKAITNKDINSGLWKVGKIMILLALCIALMGGKGSFGGVQLKWGDVKMSTVGSILALTFAVKSIAKTITNLGQLDVVTLAKGTTAVQAIMVTLGACIALMGGSVGLSTPGLSGKLNWGQVKLSTIGTILALALAIWGIGNTVAQLGSISLIALSKGMTAVKSIAVVLSLCIALLGLDFNAFGIKVSTNNIKLSTIGAILFMVGGIMALGLEVALLGALPTTVIQNGLTAIGYIALILTGMVGIVANFGNMDWSDVGGIVASVAGLVLVGGTVIRLASLPKEMLDKGLIAIGLIALAIVAIMAVSYKMPATLKSVVAIGVTALSIYAVGRVVEQMALIKNINQGLLALGGITLAIGLLMGIAALAGKAGGLKAIGVLLSTAIAIGVIALAIDKLAQIKAEDLTKACIALAAGLGIILAAGALAIPLAAGLIILAGAVLAVGAGFMMFGQGALNVVVAATMLWSLIKTIWSDLNNFFSNLGRIISNAWTGIGDALGRLWNTITSKFGEWISKMPEKGRDLIKKVGEGMTSFISNIPEYINKVGDAIVDTFTKFDWSSLVESGKEVVGKFMDGMGSMVDKAKKKAGDVVTAVRNFFPNSPAKDGPLSGRGWTKLGQSGETLINQWLSGMSSSDVSGTVTKIVGTVENALASVNSIQTSSIVPVLDITDNTQNGLPSILDLMNTNSRLNVDYQLLNPNGATKYTIDTLVDGMNSIHNRLYELQEKTDTQTGIIAEGRNTFVEVDGRLVNKQLAPGMERAQTAYNNKISRVKKGVIPT